MGALDAALPRDRTSTVSEHPVKSGTGSYRAYFIGITEPYTVVSEHGDKCRACKGVGTYQDSGNDCRACSGTGKRTDTQTLLRYHLENGNIEEEEVRFYLTPPKMGTDGTPHSPSTFFIRLRSLSGIKDATPASLNAWFTGLPEPIKVPCFVNIGDNKFGTALRITDVLRRVQPGAAAAKPAPAAKPRPVVQEQKPITEADFADEDFSRPSGSDDSVEIPF